MKKKTGVMMVSMVVMVVVVNNDHRWSGWPGAFCQDCFVFDQAEECLATHDIDIDKVNDCPDHQNPPCTKKSPDPRD